jgi:Uma2 family endonuclease
MAIVVSTPPRLENGAVLNREEFHRLYSECEELERVELIEGIVYMPSPISLDHSDPQTLVAEWLAAYAEKNPEVKWSLPTSLLLDDRNEPQPDALLYWRATARIQDRYLASPPELIVEVANTTASRDLHQKKQAYERNGVREYIVWRVQDAAIDWFALREGMYVLRSPDAEGVIESEVFPGLRLDVGAMLAGGRAVRDDAGGEAPTDQ